MTRGPRQLAGNVVRALAAPPGQAPSEVTAQLRSVRRRQRRLALRLQRRVDLLATELRGRDAEIAAQAAAAASLAAAPPPHADQTELVRRIWLHEQWLRAMPPSGVLVSVVIPTRHRPDLLRRALGSLLAQTYAEWEGLVVDDGEPGRAAEVRDVLAGLADPRLRLVPAHVGNEGVARNTGLASATGDLVTYLDDDNVMFPLWLAALVDAAARNPEAPLLYGARVTRETGGEEWVHLAEFDRASLEQHNAIDTGQIGHRADRALRWDADLQRLSDWDLVLRLTADDPGVPVPALAVGYTTDAPDRISDTRAMGPWQARVRSRVRSSTTTGPSTG